jgi:hypothetical protein
LDQIGRETQSGDEHVLGITPPVPESTTCQFAHQHFREPLARLFIFTGFLCHSPGFFSHFYISGCILRTTLVETGTYTHSRKDVAVNLHLSIFILLLTLVMSQGPAEGQQGPMTPVQDEPRKGAIETPTTEPPRVETAKPLWHYGGFLDGAYALDFNSPSNHLFRNRSTTPRVNEGDLNMAALYLKKDVSELSRWGTELMVQGGEDSKAFGFSATAPNLPGSSWLRQFGRANISYLAPVGSGLTIQAGIFNSLIGYDSLYAKDNFSYTRPWGGDYTPYLMNGVNAAYTFNEQFAATFFIVHQYFHLANANSLPSYGVQMTYKPSTPWTVKETVYYGPDQSNTSWQFYRFFSDTIVEWKQDQWTAAFEYQIGTEEVAVPGSPRAFWTAGQLPIHYLLGGPWSLTIRPEVYWDRNGRLTGFQQFIKAVTTTLEYKLPYRWTNMIARLEYRYDESRGPGGGFFKDGEIRPGVVGLTPTQQLLIFALIWTFDSP